MTTSPGSLFIVAAPSGGGKTSLVKQLVTDLSAIQISTSHTTRDKRVGEADGVDYFFVSEAKFLEMIQQGEFIEHATVFNHFYGTSHQQILERLADGIDVVLDIDWQGAEQIKQMYPNATSIFILPPSLDVLEQRLLNRKRDAADIISDRMDRARDELSHYADFDYLIVNDDFEHALAELTAIVVASRLTIARQMQQQRKLLSFLLASK